MVGSIVISPQQFSSSQSSDHNSPNKRRRFTEQRSQQHQQQQQQHQQQQQQQQHQQQQQQQQQPQQEQFSNNTTTTNNDSNFVVRNLQEIQAEIKDRLQEVTRKHPNSILSKALYDLQENITRKKIVTVVTEIAGRLEACVDFNVPLSQLLEMFVACEEEPILSEAGLMIISATQIYSRRVDNIHELCNRISTGIDEETNAIQQEKENENSTNTTNTNNIERSRINLKHSSQGNDHLYESELLPKKFKIATNDKITEKLTDTRAFDPPENFFENWLEYKEWRLQQQKRMKGHLQYSLVCNEQYIHPSLWEHSRIEDFDYEDDVDTKRNYRIFTNYIEHRNNTLVNDVNFVLHFKVKDFIDAEEDRREEMNCLGLPSPPKRRWPPFCRSDSLRQSFNIDLNYDQETSDYLKNYVELEDAILEQEDWFEKDTNRSRRRIDFSNEFINEIFQNDDDGDAELLQLNDEISLPQNSNVTNITDNDKSQTNENDTNIISENLNNNTSSVNESNQQNLEGSTNDQSNIQNNDTQLNNNEISANSNSDNNNSTAISQSIGEEQQQISDCNQNVNTTASQKTNENNIIVRLSADNGEGVCFGDLDEVDRAMLLPTIELFDVMTSIRQKEDVDFNFKSSRIIINNSQHNILQLNIFDIDILHLISNEDFQLPVEYFTYQLELNILQIPENRLTRRKIFELSPEYDRMKKNRIKRNHREIIQRNNRIFKLNNYDMSGIPITPPPSPTRQLGFFGFNDDEINDRDLSSNHLKLHLDHIHCNDSTKISLLASRTCSRDSGLSSQAMESFNNEIIENFVNDVNDKNQNENNSSIDLNSTNIMESTRIENDSGIHSINSSSIQNTINNSNQDVQIINNLVEDNIVKRTCTNLQDELDKNEDNITSERITNWHRHLRPLLANVKERQNFDIFDLGTEIIETFNGEQQQDSIVTLEDVMKEKDPSYISRYFLSTLLLANQRNIDIAVQNQNCEEPTSLNNIQLKLISKKRHTVTNEDNVGMHHKSNTTSKKRSNSPVPSTSSEILHSLTSSTPSTSFSILSNHNQQNDLHIVNEEETIRNNSEVAITTQESIIQNSHNSHKSRRKHQINIDYEDSSTDNDSSNQIFSRSSKRYKLISNNSNTTVTTTTGNNSNIYDTNNTNNLTSSVLRGTTTLQLQTNSISINDIESINNTDTDGFTFPRKPKNFLRLTNKSFDHNDDTDSGFHSQISSGSQKSIII